MENGDLKRYYKVNNQEAKDFARLNAEGKIDKDLLPSDVGTTVVANPTGTATDDLTKIQVGETIYGIEGGTEVIANPTLAGTEDNLTGLQVGDTKYKVDSGYTINKYTANKTYTSADTDYEQLKSDLENQHLIKISDNNLVYHPTYVDNGYVYVADGTSGQTDVVEKKIAIITTTLTSVTISAITTGAFYSTTNNDSRYLKLAGGTMTGNIVTSNGLGLQSGDNTYLYTNYGTTLVTLGATNTSGLNITTRNDVDITHVKGTNQYAILDASNTSANPTLVGGETTLSSLKLNGTNYAVAGSPILNSYTIKTYTSADTDYQQLRDDLTNKLPIIVTVNSQPYEFYHSWTYEDSGTTYITYVNIQNLGANTSMVTNKLAITMTSSNVVIPSITACSTKFVEANQGTATDTLTNLNIGGTIYGIPEGTEVVANPTLAGTESALTGLQVGDTKYAVPVGYEINTYTYGTITDATTMAKLRNDIAKGHIINIGSEYYSLNFYDANAHSAVYTLISSVSNDGVTIGGLYLTDNTTSITMSGTNFNQNKITTDTASTFSGQNITGLYYASSLKHFVAKEIRYSTTAPTADNTSGYLDIRVLSSDPATRYNGYLYIITA